MRLGCSFIQNRFCFQPNHVSSRPCHSRRLERRTARWTCQKLKSLVICITFGGEDWTEILNFCRFWFAFRSTEWWHERTKLGGCILWPYWTDRWLSTWRWTVWFISRHIPCRFFIQQTLWQCFPCAVARMWTGMFSVRTSRRAICINIWNLRVALAQLNTNLRFQRVSY